VRALLWRSFSRWSQERRRAARRGRQVQLAGPCRFGHRRSAAARPGVPVGGDGVWAAMTLADQPLSENRPQVGASALMPAASRSARAVRPPGQSALGPADKYQYVSAGGRCPGRCQERKWAATSTPRDANPARPQRQTNAWCRARRGRTAPNVPSARPGGPEGERPLDGGADKPVPPPDTKKLTALAGHSSSRRSA